MRVPFVDLKAQYETIKDEVQAAINGVIDKTAFILGDEVKQLEEEFAAFCRTRYAVAVNSGTSALHLALLVAGIKSGDEVITVPNTFIATIEAILYTGVKPVLVEIDPKTYNMDPNQLASAITSKTKAILPVHLYGQPTEMGAILDIAHKHHLIVIEDACQAHGAEYRGKSVGSLGKLGCFSFYPGKNLGAYGEGGMVVTDDEELYYEIKLLRDHGSANKYDHIRVGFNYRLTGIQGAILRVKLKYLKQWNNQRRAHADLYDRLLKEYDVQTPIEANHVRHVYHLYVIRSQRRDELQQFLTAREIFTGLHYPIPVHLQKGYRFLGYEENSFPITERYAKEILSLPMYAELIDAQIEYVAKCIGEFEKGN